MNEADNIAGERIYTRTTWQSDTYTFDAAQRVHTVSFQNALQATYTYNANGSLVNTSLANGVTTEYTRNLAGLVTSVVNRHGTNVLSRFDYVYYLDGNASVITEQMGPASRRITYTYDTARRLTREHATGFEATTRSYEFDNRGNRTRMIVSGSENYIVSYTYNLNNVLLTETRTGSNPFTATFTHDRNGNQLNRTSGGQTDRRTYNAFNQLTEFSNGTTISAYTYRADGLRRRMTVNGITTYHIWARGHVVLEHCELFRNIFVYIRGAGGQLVRSPLHGWYLFDARGSVVQRTGNQGQVFHTCQYSAFGVELNPNPNNTNRFRFNGMYWDAHTQTYYTANRHYSPRLGRWLSEDPHWSIHAGNMIFGDSPTMRNDRYMPSVHAILQSGNLYVFAINNPVRWVDPSGLYIKCPMKLWEMVKAGHKYADQALKWFINENIKFARWAGGHIQRGWNAISNLFSSSTMALSSVPGTFKLTKNAVQHISKHVVEIFAKQVPHIKPGRLATKLESLSFFNPSWTQQQVNFFVEQSVNFLHS